MLPVKRLLFKLRLQIKVIKRYKIIAIAIIHAKIIDLYEIKREFCHDPCTKGQIIFLPIKIYRLGTQRPTNKAIVTSKLPV